MSTQQSYQLDGDGHLCNLYLKWRQDPARYNAQMAETVDKIIHYVIRDRQLKPAYRNHEEYDDLRQELRLLCFERVLPRIKDPSNKRIFNFLYTSILRRISRRKKSSVVRNLREKEAEQSQVGHQYLSDAILEIEDLPTFGSELTDRVANMLAEGHTKTDVRQILQLNNHQLKRHMDTIRNTYKEMGYGSKWPV